MPCLNVHDHERLISISPTAYQAVRTSPHLAKGAVLKAVEKRKTRLVFMAMTCVLASGFFALDLWLPRGVAEGELYAALVVLAFWSAPPRFLLLVTSGMSLFIVLGFFWAPGPPSWVTLTNRGLGLVIMWVIALLLLHRKRTQEELEHGSLKLRSAVTELTKRSHELTLLNEMATQLQGCATSEAAYAVITTYARQFLPGNSGALGIKRPAHNYIEIVQEWGESGVNKPVFALEECCALRHNEPFAVDDPTGAVVCQHLTDPPPTGYACIPIVAQGEVLGILFLQSVVTEWNDLATEAGNLGQESPLRLAGVMAHQLSLALANLRLRDTLRIQSIRDPLTGLFNRRHLEESLDLELHRAQRSSLPVAIIMLDLDHFKQINDTFGHPAGDAVLQSVARVLHRRCRAGDVACRLGGEEFVLLLPGSSLPVAVDRAETIREVVEGLQVSYGNQIVPPVTMSVGVATFPEHGATSHALIRAADAALYRAKNGGRNRLTVAGRA